MPVNNHHFARITRGRGSVAFETKTNDATAPEKNTSNKIRQ